MSDVGNTIGRLVGQPPLADVSAADANPPIVAETPEEAAWLAKIHAGLDGLGAIPEVGAVFDGANALVYAVEGNAVQAGISGGAAALDLVPGVGTAGKVAEFGIKGAAKLAAKHEAEHLAEQEAKHIAEQEAKQAEKEAGKEAGEAGKPPTGEDGAKIKGGPCDHLKQGSGKGPYRGGAHSKTSKPANDGKDSHHMPAKDVSPLPESTGPAIQMDPADHHETSSNGRGGAEARQFRQMIGDLLKTGNWRQAMAIEIRDVREIARSIGDPRKYNEAIGEMLEYFRCLEKHGLLPLG
jgi:hypothetical protein